MQSNLQQGRDDSPSASVSQASLFPPLKPPRRRQALYLFLLLFFCYSYVHQRSGWNQNSRLDLLHAIFVYNTLTIDAYHENTGDKSVHNGHYYSDKAPGIVVLALPAFAVSAVILYVFGINTDSAEAWLISDWITTALSVGLITALGGAAVFLFLCKLLAATFNSKRDRSSPSLSSLPSVETQASPYAFLTTLAVFLGSSPFPYATMLFSHAAVIGLLCIALWAIADSEFFSRHIRGYSPTHFPTFPPSHSPTCSDKQPIHPSTNPLIHSSTVRHLLAGLCCGFAIASEFPAAIAAGGVLALAILTSWKRGLLLAVGAIPPLLLIPAYNWVCFGGPLSFGYHYVALTEFGEMNKGLFGVTFPPKAGAAYLVLLSPERGLLFWTPFFLIAILGFKPLWKASRTVFWSCLFVVIVTVIAISGYYMPDGGNALGPRHLASMLPFAMLPAAFGLRRHWGPGFFLSLYSLALTGLGTLIDAAPPADLQPRIIDFYKERLADGYLAENVGQALGCGPSSLLPVLTVLILTLFHAYRRNVLNSKMEFP